MTTLEGAGCLPRHTAARAKVPASSRQFPRAVFPGSFLQGWWCHHVAVLRSPAAHLLHSPGHRLQAGPLFNSHGYDFTGIRPVDPSNTFMVVLYFCEIEDSVRGEEPEALNPEP